MEEKKARPSATGVARTADDSQSVGDSNILTDNSSRNFTRLNFGASLFPVLQFKLGHTFPRIGN